MIERASPRAKLLEPPERARDLVGQGVIALSAVGQLCAIGRIAPPPLEALIALLDSDGDALDGTVPGTYRLKCLVHPTTMC